MKTAARVFQLALLVAASGALPRTAHSQVNLAWNNCIGVGTHAEAVQYACDGSRDGIPYRLVASFVTTQAYTVDGIGIAVKFQAAAFPTLPDYWDLDKSLSYTGCREWGSVLFYHSSRAGVGDEDDCVYAFPGLPVSIGVGSPPGNATPSSYVFMAGVGLTDNSQTTLNPGQHYLAGIVHIDPIQDLGSGVCAGCEQEICIQLREVELWRYNTGSPPILLNGPATRDYVHWQGPTPGICAGATPVRQRTWGTIKAIYR